MGPVTYGGLPPPLVFTPSYSDNQNTVITGTTAVVNGKGLLMKLVHVLLSPLIEIRLFNVCFGSEDIHHTLKC